MYRYETHLHTNGVSLCAKADIEENLRYYKSLGYTGVFVTNHFVDCGILCDRTEPGRSYDERLDFFFDECDRAKVLGKEIGIAVFSGVEMTHGGTDFLVYGLSRDFYHAHSELRANEVAKSELLPKLIEYGALVVQAHPFREARYIDHIRLFPRAVQAVEVYNACRTAFENKMAAEYAENYNLIPFAGSDNHRAHGQTHLAGIEFPFPIESEAHFVRAVLAGQGHVFVYDDEKPAE